MIDIAGLIPTLVAGIEERSNRRNSDTRQGVTVGGNERTTSVVFDGDTQAILVSSLVGEIEIGTRVTVLFVPPHGAYVIGPLPGGSPLVEELLQTNITGAGQPTCRWHKPTNTLVVADYEWILSGEPPESGSLEIDLPVPAHLAGMVVGTARLGPAAQYRRRHCITTPTKTTFYLENRFGLKLSPGGAYEFEWIRATVNYEPES